MKLFVNLGYILFVLSGCAVAETTPSGNAEQMAVSTPVSRLANADVVFVKAVQTRSGRWNFAVSISHPDTGWSDYADGWDLVDANGVVLKANKAKFTRVLAHPHVGQVPFTRSQKGIQISTDWVTVRAHDLVDGFGGKTVRVVLSKDSGPGYSIRRK